MVNSPKELMVCLTQRAIRCYSLKVFYVSYDQKMYIFLLLVIRIY